jgi:hypothetical protein
MKRLIYIPLLTLLTSCAIAQSSKDAEASRDYKTAIAQAEVKQGTDRRLELESCIKHWDAMHIQRVALLNESLGESRSVLLEVGNSGFPRYDYVRIDGFLLRSSFNGDVDVSRSLLGKRLMGIYADQSIDLRGNADSEVDDGDCYYLTVNSGGMQKSIAVYGTPESTPSGLLIKEMLEMAQGSK